MKLTSDDYAALERSFITREIANAAGLYRVSSIDGRELVGRSGSGHYAGIVFPYPGMNGSTILYRLRLDHPPMDPAGKPQHKYLTAPGERNRLYFPPCDPKLLTDPAMPIVFVEGEKKCLAIWRVALESTNGDGIPAFLPIAVAGVWTFRGTIGIRTDANGERVPEKGVISDFERIPWSGRKVTILFDANAATNESVRGARRELARELTRRAAEVWIAELPQAPGVNGIDDYLGLFGLANGLEVLRRSTRYEWRKELIVTEKGKVAAILANGITALRSAPEWCGVLAFNEFSHSVTTTRQTPWGPVDTWTEQDDRLCADWLQHNGICIKAPEAASAVETVARDSNYHPVRAYLNSLNWDRVPRLDDWLTLYLGAEASDLTRAFGAKWLISAVARVFSPGCKADCCLILEGPQGSFKSTALRVLAGSWFTDDIADLGSKDAALCTIGVWLIELSELDAMRAPEMSRVKSFMSRTADRFRPPYGRRLIVSPRQCVFAGTVNHSEYLRDETGGRRFWPVVCGRIKIDALQRDRDQLFAEAVNRYRRGEHWWLETPELNTAAAREQSERYSTDPWQPVIQKWLEEKFGEHPDPKVAVSIADVLRMALDKQTGIWTRTDEMRVGAIFRILGWSSTRPRGEDPSRPRMYSPPAATKGS
jgi:predicted P-loop ATPase